METRADRRAVGRAAGRAAAVCLSLIVLAGCGAAARSSTATQAEGPVSSEPQVLTIKATEFSFGAPTLRVQVNRPVRLVMENGGAIEHDVRAVKVPARD
ncbi:MAG TPA: hypothetical protein VFX49_03585, partial [Chloroflexota bacterium]|nr:hypothetical protein [Chloroflexota bacterium]